MLCSSCQAAMDSVLASHEQSLENYLRGFYEYKSTRHISELKDSSNGRCFICTKLWKQGGEGWKSGVTFAVLIDVYFNFAIAATNRETTFSARA